MGVCVRTTPRSSRFTTGKEICCPLCRRLGGTQDRSGQVRKISPPTGIRSTDCQALRDSPYRLRHDLKKWGVEIWYGFFWFRTEYNSRFLWMKSWKVGRVPVNVRSCSANPWLSSQKGFCFRKIGSVMILRRCCLKARNFPKGNHVYDSKECLPVLWIYSSV